MSIKTESALISRILTPALGFWLHSQLETVENLDFQISGSDRQMVKGLISRITLQATGAVYQGLHFRGVSLVAQSLRVNLGQMLRGKAFRLLQPVATSLEVTLTAEDLRRSLSSSLLGQALQDLFYQVLGGQSSHRSPWGLEDHNLQWTAIALEMDRLILEAQVNTPGEGVIPITFQTQLRSDGRFLSLDSVAIEGGPLFPAITQGQWTIDLGETVTLTTLRVTPEGILCQGELQILPET